MLNSYYRELQPIKLPRFQARRKYMHSFDLANIEMADGFEDYRDVVTQLCAKAGAFEGMAHMTVDEGVISKGKTQRRPGPHVDGCFIPAQNSWGHTGGGGWLHNCNNIAAEKLGRMPIIVASNIAACKCWSGLFDAEPASDGDLSHVELPEGKILQPNVAYLLSGDCVHESMPMTETVERIFLRIALPVGFTV